MRCPYRKYKILRAGKNPMIQTPADRALWEKSKTILSRSGVSMHDAVHIFLEQVVQHDGMPFDISLPGDDSPRQPMEEPAWNEEMEGKFQNALATINAKYGNALKKLAG